MKPPATRLACLVVAVALSAPSGVALADAAQRGLVFVKTNCMMCHAIGRYDESRLAIAPPLRTLHESYPVESLEESFAEGIVTGHPTVPQFQLDAAQISDLMGYVNTRE
jgi:mono/diheme cytochrome c family protein